MEFCLDNVMKSREDYMMDDCTPGSHYSEIFEGRKVSCRISDCSPEQIIQNFLFSLNYSSDVKV